MQLQLTLSTSTKQCTKCRESKPLTEFHKNRSARDGLYCYCKSCAKSEAKRRWQEFPEVREAHKETTRRYKARLRGEMPAFTPRGTGYKLPEDLFPKKRNPGRRRMVEALLFVNAVKAEVGCQVCGEREPVCIDFHHVDPATKKYTLGARFSRQTTDPERVMAEMRKCICLCANCHRKHHWGTLDTSTLAPVDDATMLRALNRLA